MAGAHLPRRVRLSISAFLSLFRIGVIPGLWDLFLWSPRVLTFLGFPDAALGVLAYATEVVLTFVGGRERWRTMPCTVLTFGVVSAGERAANLHAGGPRGCLV